MALLPSVYMILFCVGGTITATHSSSITAEIGTHTTTATNSSHRTTETILVIVGVGCSFVVIVAFVVFFCYEIRSRSKMRYHVENGDCTERDEMPEDNKKIIMEELGNQRPPHDEETFTTNRSYSEKQKSENVSDDDVYDQTLATILHETDNSNMYYCSKDSDYDSTRRHSGKYMLSGCELIDTKNINLASQNMKFVGE